jgi:hypothetical protein
MDPSGALAFLLTIKSQAHHRTTKTRTTQAHDRRGLPSRYFRQMLRQKLNEIAENGNPSSHSGLIDALRAQHPHAIKALVHDPDRAGALRSLTMER